MRILFRNLLKEASLIATNENANYPVSNVSNNSLKSKFKATANNTVITATLAEASVISTFAFGGHNINSLQITLTKSDLSTVVYSYTAAELKFSDAITRKMIYEDAVSDVVEIEYSVISLTDVEIGGISAGQYIQMPGINLGSTTQFLSSASSQDSRDWITFGVPGETAEVFTIGIDGALLTDYNLINAFFDAVQTITPYFVDRWEESPEFPVMFGRNTRSVSWKKADGIIFDSFTMVIRECK